MLDSVVDEITQLFGPGFKHLFAVVVPPLLIVPFVEFNDLWSELEQAEKLEACQNNPETEGIPDVVANLSTDLGATDNEGNPHPESEDPGNWNDPGDGSVVNLLEDAVVALDVGEEP